MIPHTRVADLNAQQKLGQETTTQRARSKLNAQQQTVWEKYGNTAHATQISAQQPHFWQK